MTLQNFTAFALWRYKIVRSLMITHDKISGIGKSSANSFLCRSHLYVASSKALWKLEMTSFNLAAINGPTISGDYNDREL
ncbi:MAG: hypothetical protein HQM09_20195 [Candidatus Riflebacteria bacterium]|nr:hypothetical protein [Candidatus Riflebacteria bacterium]